MLQPGFHRPVAPSHTPSRCSHCLQHKYQLLRMISRGQPIRGRLLKSSFMGARKRAIPWWQTAHLLIKSQRLFLVCAPISELPSNMITMHIPVLHASVYNTLNRSTTTILTRKQYRFRARFVVLLKIKQKKYLKGQCQKSKLLAQTSTWLGIQKKFFCDAVTLMSIAKTFWDTYFVLTFML